MAATPKSEALHRIRELRNETPATFAAKVGGQVTAALVLAWEAGQDQPTYDEGLRILKLKPPALQYAIEDHLILDGAPALRQIPVGTGGNMGQTAEGQVIASVLDRVHDPEKRLEMLRELLIRVNELEKKSPPAK